MDPRQEFVKEKHLSSGFPEMVSKFICSFWLLIREEVRVVADLPQLDQDVLVVGD
jgi:hypothetical protein